MRIFGIEFSLPFIKKLITPFVSILFVTSLCSLLFVILPSINDAKKAGDMAGKSAGTAAGIVGGALTALDELPKTQEIALQDATSAKDTTTDIVTQIRSGGTLEVLTAKIRAFNVEVQGKVYASYRVTPGTAVFSVDLSNLGNSNCTVKGDNVTITIPSPHAELEMNYGTSETIAEYTNNNPIDSLGADKDLGITGHQNSISVTTEQARENIANYDFLIEQAEESARIQITELVQNIRGEKCNVNVIFKGDGGVTDVNKSKFR